MTKRFLRHDQQEIVQMIVRHPHDECIDLFRFTYSDLLMIAIDAVYQTHNEAQLLLAIRCRTRRRVNLTIPS